MADIEQKFHQFSASSKLQRKARWPMGQAARLPAWICLFARTFARRVDGGWKPEDLRDVASMLPQFMSIEPSCAYGF